MGMSLKTLRVPELEVDHPEDVAEIKAELERQGYTASESAIAWAYSEWSEDRWCASWMMMNVGIVSIEDAAKGVREYLVE
jgi:hypothetical protein